VTPVVDRSVRLSDFAHSATVTTRWNDNDVYGHVNNVEYYAFFDTIINGWLIEQGGLDIHSGAVIGLCVESRCRFYAPLSFPQADGG
jgi:acyl-CoA thioester hydrolase